MESTDGMDLRTTCIAENDMARIQKMIVSRKISYQPFVFRDDWRSAKVGLSKPTPVRPRPPRKGVIYWPTNSLST
jgi:hypothetical protein